MTSAVSHTAFLSRRRFSSLNGLRAVAILEVIWHHSSGHLTGPLGRGVGVDLSFAISGFVITTQLVREFARRGRIDVRRFYRRRTLRIFPLYFVVLGAYVLLVMATRLRTPAGEAFMHHLSAFATFTSNWFVPRNNSETIFGFAWSLGTQEQFYLLWAPALLLCLAPGRWWRAGAVMLALVVIDQIVRHAINSTALPLTMLRSIATPICLGALWSLVLHSPTGFAVTNRVIGHRAATPVLLAMLTVAFAVAAPFGALEFLLAVLVATCCIREDHLAAPVLTARPAVFIGEISYGMYLLHMLGVNAVRPLVGEHFGIPVFMAGTVVTIGLAYCSYRWFETPILRYRDGRPTQRRAVATTSPAGSASRGRPVRSRA
jgi:peptidoglycan/LPS O-acetylase OafA/YrhL